MANDSGDYLLSCDWGTSSFRLRLFSRSRDAVLAEVTASEGIASVYNQWKKDPDCPRLPFFRNILKKYLNELSERVVVSKKGISLAGIPLVISGMASSSLGIEELPYATLPFSLEGNGAVTRKFEASADFPHEILLISGLRSEQDVMRGEETQLLGLAAQGMLPADNAICLFPGTHSKHVRVRDGILVKFETYMTGEFFQLLTRQSILSESVEAPEPLIESQGSEISGKTAEAFRQGLNYSADTHLLHSLFSVRTGYLFGKQDKASNFYFLSGLLIGAELNNLKADKTTPVLLCGGSKMSPFYKLALHQPRMPEKIVIVPPEAADLSALHGQLVIAT
ncbi:MAG TPA: 2-dehydro-3-deoxygalactonokinase [Anseongella sp.]